MSTQFVLEQTTPYIAALPEAASTTLSGRFADAWVTTRRRRRGALSEGDGETCSVYFMFFLIYISSLVFILKFQFFVTGDHC